MAELDPPSVLDGMLPGLGHDWTATLGTLSTVYYTMATYADEWEVVAARWVVDDHELLQPAEPSWYVPLIMSNNFLRQKVAKNELNLCDSPISPQNRRRAAAMVNR